MTTTRRQFLATSTAAAITAPVLYAGEKNLLKVGLIGCGSRGTGAAINALQADKNAKLVAMADAFDDRLAESLATLQKKESIAGQVDVKPED
ncbi:MAG: twin-arginine translocation signal domain-containing protein, partial [Gemmataceae bacterium]|nr:twin-arginine translocation signal domain-containing protein [Gemmataceae bacterium]